MGNKRWLYLIGLVILCLFVLFIVLTNNTNETTPVGTNKTLLLDSPSEISTSSPDKSMSSNNKELAFIEAEILPQLNEKSEEAIFKAKYSDPREFIKLNQSQILYKTTREMIPKSQLPLLYKLLEDEDYIHYWPNIARTIGYISDDPNSVPVLLDYFQRNDSSNISDMGKIGGKIWTIAWIGKIGGDTANSILKKAVTNAGAQELAKAWITKETWPNQTWSTETAIGYIQNAAMKGLIYTQKPENIALVEKLYNEEKEMCYKNKKKTVIMSYLIDAMAEKDFIADHNNNVESWFLFQDKREEMGYSEITPYIEKYTFSFKDN